MATNFPTSLDSLTNPTASDKLNSVTVPHASQHADINDAVEALEAKVGVNGSSVVTSHDYLIDKQSVVPYDDASARTTAVPSPVEGQMSYLKDTNSVEVYDGSAWTAVGGKILQVVSTTKTDTFSASVTAGNDTAVTGLSATITPSSATSKILAVVNVGGCRSVDSSTFAIRLFRGATEVGSGAAASNRTNVLAGIWTQGSGTENIVNVAANYLDSPATTSATTYTVHAVNVHASSTLTVYVNRTNDDTDNSGQMRPSSTITLMEVSA